MTTIGFMFSVGNLYYTALSGTKASPQFEERNKLTLPANYDIPQLAEWYETQLDLILNNLAPTQVNYKLSINNVSNNTVQKVYFGQGILTLLCKKKGIGVSNISPLSIVPTNFSLPKTTNLSTHIDSLIGTHPPHWDSNMRDCALISLILLP